MGEWVNKKLGDIVSKIGSGSTPAGGQRVYQKNGIPFIRSQNVNDNSLILDDIYISEEINNKMKGSTVRALDILLNITGASIGRSCVVPRDFDVGNVNQHVCIIRVKNTSPYFVQFYLSSFKGQKMIEKSQSGSGREGLNFKNIRIFTITLPTLPEQQKIADFLTAVDDKINQLTRKKTLLEQYKKGVMQKIFSQEIRFKDDDGKDFPEWEVKRLGDFLIPTLREIDKPKNKYLAIGIRSHFKGTFQKPDSDPEKIAMDKLYVVKENDLIVNITFAWEGAITIVKREDEGGLVSHRFPTYIFNRSLVIQEYFKHVFFQKRFNLMLELISPGGAGRNRVMSKTDFLILKWNFPTLPEQKKIADFLTAIDKKIELVNCLLEKTKAWKKGLLQQLFV